MAQQPYQLTEIYPTGMKWQTWGVLVPGTTPFTDLLKPDAWAHIQGSLTPRDTIVVKSEAGLYNAELEVERKFVGGAIMRVIRLWEAPVIDVATATKNTGLKVEWGGPTHKYRIIDAASLEVVEHGFGTQAEALAKIPALVAERKKA